MKNMSVLLFCFLTSACSIYTHDNETISVLNKLNGEVVTTYHKHDLNIVSWRKLNEGALNVDKHGAIKGSADKLDTDVESVKLLNNAVKLGAKLVSPVASVPEVVEVVTP